MQRRKRLKTIVTESKHDGHKSQKKRSKKVNALKEKKDFFLWCATDCGICERRRQQMAADGRFGDSVITERHHLIWLEISNVRRAECAFASCCLWWWCTNKRESVSSFELNILWIAGLGCHCVCGEAPFWCPLCGSPFTVSHNHYSYIAHHQ